MTNAEDDDDEPPTPALSSAASTTTSDDDDDENDVEKVESTLRPLVLLLASSKLDAKSPSVRSSAVKKATALVTKKTKHDDDDAMGHAVRLLGDGGLAMDAAKRCHSVHAYRRLSALYSIALLRSASSPSSSTSTTTSTCCVSLASAICHLLSRSQSVDLLHECSSSINVTSTANIAPECKLDENSIAVLVKSFMEVARRGSGEGGGNKGDYAPALSLTSGLLTILDGHKENKEESKLDRDATRKEMLSIFIQQTLKSSAFAPRCDVRMCGPYLGTLTQSELEESDLASTMGLKLRANPEKVLETVEAILACLASSAAGADGAGAGAGGDEATATSTTTMIDVTNHLEGDTKLLSSTMKQLRSSKGPHIRHLASCILIHLASLAPSIHANGPTDAVVKAVCEALIGKKPSMALSTPDLRLEAYRLLDVLGGRLVTRVEVGAAEEEGDKNDDDAATLRSLVDSTLSCLSSTLTKETTTTTAMGDGNEPTAKEWGFRALLVWMSLSKKVVVGDVAKGCAGYGAALTYLAKPTPDAAKPSSSSSSSEFRFRIGSLLLVGAQQQSEALVESIITDVFQHNVKFAKDLQSVIEYAAKKHAASDLVPQVDGLIALHLMLTHAAASSSSSIKWSSLPPSMIKVISSGSSAYSSPGRGSGKSSSWTSFLYGKAMTDASSTDTLVGSLLHRVVAISVKLMSKEDEESEGGKATKHASSSGLVRMMEKDDSSTGGSSSRKKDRAAVSAAAHAIACCVANPTTTSASAPSSSTVATAAAASSPPTVHASIQTITTYSPSNAKATDAILHALFEHVNDSSLINASVAESMNDSRKARELYEPCNESYAKLPPAVRGKCSPTAAHGGYDPHTVRRVADSLIGSASEAESVFKALLLSHVGTTLKSMGRQRGALVSKTIGVLKETIVPLCAKTEKKVEDDDDDDDDDDEGEENGVLMERLADFIALYASSFRERDDASTPEQDGGAEQKAEKDASSSSGKKKGASSKGASSSSRAQDPSADDDGTTNQKVISTALHESALSLITTLGGIAGNFDPEYDDPREEENVPYAFARKLCVDEMPSCLSAHLLDVLHDMEPMKETDVDLYRSPKGVLFVEKSAAAAAAAAGDGGAGASAAEKSQNAEKKRAVKSRKAKGDFGAGFEEEEWERQMRKEMEEKKKKAKASAPAKAAAAVALTPEQKKLLAEQTKERARLSGILDGDYPRTLAAIRCLCSSEIEVGNAALPTLSPSVIATVVSTCEAVTHLPRLREDSFDTLSSLAACVYEIDETHASTLARALAISYRQSASSDGTDSKPGPLSVSALPSPCASAACSIFEMEEYNDVLSGPSFAFLFPILRAALTGPRTVAGCEAALLLLHRHTPLLAGDEAHASVEPLRKDMAISVLELLSHDRSQTFVDPSPYEALVACYKTGEADAAAGPVLSTSEIAPLLGERGALGSKNCRIGAMTALASIATDHPRLVKNNPLIENRIWVNCFATKDEKIRTAARKTWRIANGHAGEEEDKDGAPLDKPSKLYIVPLLPLLSHSDQCIASAAADAFAHAMGMHNDSVERNIVRLCNTHIASFPTSFDDDEPKPAPIAAPKALTAVPKKKAPKRIDTGLPKKTKKKSLAGSSLSKITGAPAAPKRKVGKLVTKKAPSKERTIDQREKELLENQFKSADSVKKDDAEKDSPAKVAVRLGVLRAIASLTDPSASVELEISVLKLLIGFLMAYGLADGDEKVRNEARNAARDIVASNGSSDEAIAFLLPHFEAVLNTGNADDTSLGSLNTDKVPRDVAASDRRKEGVVVALGSVALHLKGDENVDKINSTIDMLIAALSTPSESVQSSVALCLSKLMKKGRTQERIETILSDLTKDCLHGSTLAARRGAAYGISAVVKGSGIASLKKYEIVKKLEDACASGSSSAKEGALFAIELLSDRLGLLFEPYVIVLLPSLLRAFSDSNDHVRTAADNTVGLIMSKLSGHGVKLVMPAVLEELESSEWRSKQASIHMLGSMSHCAPKQLASCLPKVVPKLTEAFSDTHPKVKKSAEDALGEISKVIRNPEISSISSELLHALTDPATGTVKALEALIETEFLHAIDAPSLALIVPVLHRGLRDRAATTKRYGALISGNMVTMINDPRDFVPYLPVLLPDLKYSLLDPIPDVRSISAKALGSLTRGLGEIAFPDLRPWLIETLKSEEGSSVERSGAAQGLTEVLVAGGADLTETVMMEEILPLKGHPKASTREGVLWVLTFLPSTLGQAFTPLIDASLPALLSGLSDDSEPVRDVALRAGRVLIRSHGKAHVDKILPSIEEGLSNEDYRIRVASLMLLGDLLSMIGGTKVVKGDADTQEDIRQAERAQAQIALVLGSETRKRVLSSLYMTRSDTAAVVRQSAVQVWKTVVSVTPRTLREILSVLVGQIVTSLASGHPEQTQVAGRCLGDIVQKLGDSVLPQIIPVLRDSLYRGDEHTRRGVCVGLTEVIACSSKEQIIKYIEILVKAVQDALCDEDEGVREMAAACFQSLHNVVGNRALEEVVPTLLVSMESSDEVAKHRALNGLTGILSIRSRELLPYLIPRLTRVPVTKSHADALASIARVTGGTIHMHFNTIIPTLISELAGFYDRDLDEEEVAAEESLRDCSRAVCGSVEEIGVNWLVGEIASKCGSDKESVRKESCFMFQVVVEERKSKADFYEQVPIILRELIYRLNDESPQVLKATNAALKALSTDVPAEELVNHIEFIRNLINSMVSESRRRKGGVGDAEFLLPGFNMPKGLEPLLPIYQRGILYGNSTIREASAAGLGELISLTANKYLAGPFIIKMTGPLLRIVGDRNPSAVKIAIIQTLGLILTKGGPALRAFVPQFQTTFVKALSDPSRQVRVEAIKALAKLMPLSTRLDPLIKELVSSSLGKGPAAAVETAGAVAVQTATLEALAVVLTHGGKKAKLPESIPSALDAGKELLSHEDDGVREGAAKVIGTACELLGVDTANEVLREVILDRGRDRSETKHGRACGCYRILASGVGSQIDAEMVSDVTKLVKTFLQDEKDIVREAACVAIGAVLGSSSDAAECLASVETSILRAMDPKETMGMHQAMARGLCVAAKMKPDLFQTKDGLNIMSSALKLAMSGAQRVQLAYNDFLWLALDVASGDAGLEAYSALAHFDDAKPMKTLYSKVLARIKDVDFDSW